MPQYYDNPNSEQPVETKIIKYYDLKEWETAIKNAKRAEIYAHSWRDDEYLALEIYVNREIEE